MLKLLKLIIAKLLSVIGIKAKQQLKIVEAQVIPLVPEIKSQVGAAIADVAKVTTEVSAEIKKEI